MIKKIIVRVLATLGFIQLLAFVGVGVLFYKTFHHRDHPTLPNTILDLELDHALTDKPHTEDWIWHTNPLGSLRDVIDRLHKATQDPNVKGVVVHFTTPQFSSLAQIQELRRALHRFQQAHKTVVAYGETFGEASSGLGPYYLATACQEIWVQPLGILNIAGLSITQPFGRKFLESIGVSPEIETREKYKTAYDFLKESTMSEANRRQLQDMLQSFLNQIVSGIAQGRHITPQATLTALDEAPYFRLDDAIKRGLIDHVGHREQVYQALEKKFKAELNRMPFENYAAARSEYVREDTPKIAVVFAEGMIVSGRKRDSVLSSSSLDIDEILDNLERAEKDSTVKAVIFRINSPGGSPLASERIWYALDQMRQRNKKPIFVSMGDVAASGGYWIALPAHKIIANPGTLTGSIGVIFGKFSLEKLWEKLGIRWETLQTSPRANLGNLNRSYTPDEKKWVVEATDFIYETFLDKVSQGRHLPKEHVHHVAQGRVWTGEQALKAGLVDALGGLDTTIDLVKAHLKLTDLQKKEIQVVYVTKRSSFMKLFSEFLFDQAPLGQLTSYILKEGVASGIEGLKTLQDTLQGAQEGWSARLGVSSPLKK